MKCARAILLSVACLPLQNFSALTHIPHDFRKTNTDFLFKFVWNIYDPKKNEAKYGQICLLVFMYSTLNYVRF